MQQLQHDANANSFEFQILADPYSGDVFYVLDIEKFSCDYHKRRRIINFDRLIRHREATCSKHNLGFAFSKASASLKQSITTIALHHMHFRCWWMEWVGCSYSHFQLFDSWRKVLLRIFLSSQHTPTANRSKMGTSVRTNDHQQVRAISILWPGSGHIQNQMMSKAFPVLLRTSSRSLIFRYGSRLRMSQLACFGFW